MVSDDNIFETIIEKYRFWIGGILILAIVCGSAVLIWQENYRKPSLESRITDYESRISELEDRYEEYQVSDIKYQAEEQVSQQNIPEQGQVAGASSQNADKSKQITVSQPTEGKININTATIAELDTLPGIGPAYAQRIIDYRNAHGGFKSIEEVKNVKGIRDKTFLKFKDQITL